jgi:hypothetical protein
MNYLQKIFKHLNGKKYNSHVCYLCRVSNTENFAEYDDLFIASDIKTLLQLLKLHVIDSPVKWLPQCKHLCIELIEYHVNIANRNNIKTFYTLLLENGKPECATCDIEYIQFLPAYFKNIREM